MRKSILFLFIALCAFMTSCGANVEGDTQFSDQLELSESSMPSEVPVISEEPGLAPDVNADEQSGKGLSGKTESKDLERVIGEWKIVDTIGTGYISSTSYPTKDFIGGKLTIRKNLAKFKTPGKKYDFAVENPEYVIKWQSADDFFSERYAQYDSFGFKNPKKVRLIKIKNHNKPLDDIGTRFWIRDDDHIVIDGPEYYLAERQK